MTDAERLEALYRSAQQVRASGLTRDDAARLYAAYVQFVSAFVNPEARYSTSGVGSAGPPTCSRSGGMTRPGST